MFTVKGSVDLQAKLKRDIMIFTVIEDPLSKEKK